MCFQTCNKKWHENIKLQMCCQTLEKTFLANSKLCLHGWWKGKHTSSRCISTKHTIWIDVRNWCIFGERNSSRILAFGGTAGWKTGSHCWGTRSLAQRARYGKHRASNRTHGPRICLYRWCVIQKNVRATNETTPRKKFKHWNFNTLHILLPILYLPAMSRYDIQLDATSTRSTRKLKYQGLPYTSNSWLLRRKLQLGDVTHE